MFPARVLPGIIFQAISSHRFIAILVEFGLGGTLDASDWGGAFLLRSPAHVKFALGLSEP